MTKDPFGNYVAGLEDAGVTLTPFNAPQIFGSNDGGVIGGVPQVTPTTQTAIYIGDDGTQYQYFDSAWH